MEELLKTLRGDHRVCGDNGGSCWYADEMRQAADMIERMQKALRGTLTVIDRVAPHQPEAMQNGFKIWRAEIEAALKTDMLD